MTRIRFEFVGGPHDGKVVRGRLGEGSEAERFYFFTHRGRIGQHFKVASKYSVDRLAREGLEHSSGPIPRHYYRVTDRRERNEKILIRAEYVGHKHPLRQE